MQRRWLDLARSYEFTEQLSRFTEPLKLKRRAFISLLGGAAAA